MLSAEGEVLGFGDYSAHSSIRVRLFAWGKEPPTAGWLADRIAQAVMRRRTDPQLAVSNAMRLVNAEGDGLPGLVADRYDDLVVMKLTSAGMAARRGEVVEALREASQAAVGLERGDANAARREGMAVEEGKLWGDAIPELVDVREGDCVYQVDPLRGQKTGFYLDQRDARAQVALWSQGRDVLDCFAYTGGFSVAAARAGARSVTLVDSSSTALAQAESHLSMNAPDTPALFHKTDGFRFLRGAEQQYDLLVVDPPPLAKRRGEVSRATRAYKDLLIHALRHARPGALVFAFSCSHHVGGDLFRKVAFGASLDANRPVRVLGTLGAPTDHPVALDHPEGDYLSGLVLQL